MKRIRIFLAVCLLSMQFAFAQDKALFIDQNGNVGVNTAAPAATLDVNGSMNINGDLNGLKIYNFSGTQSPYLMKDVGQYYATWTISAWVDCQSPGTTAVVAYDISSGKLKVISQGGTGQTNRVEVSSSASNKLIFYNDCGCTANLTFAISGKDVSVTVTYDNPGCNNLSEFNIISQGF